MKKQRKIQKNQYIINIFDRFQLLGVYIAETIFYNL